MLEKEEVRIVKEALSNFEDINDFLICNVVADGVSYIVKKSEDFNIADKNNIVDRFIDVRGGYFDIFKTTSS